MRYADALKAACKAGAAHAEGLPFLAQTCHALAHVYGCRPDLLYRGAVTLDLDPHALVAKLHGSVWGLCDVLMAAA